MKKLLLLTPAFMFWMLFSGCDIEDPFFYDNDPPSAPNNVWVLNGDNVVDIYWDESNDRDVEGYNVYYAYSYNGKYTLMGSTSRDHFTDYDAENGVKLYYAVAAYDDNGNESDLSYDVAYATPRPEGFNESIFDYRVFPNNSGYSFAQYKPVPFDANAADFFFERFDGKFYLNVWDDTDIQDMGSTTDIYDIPFAPNNGWSPTKDARAYVGHTYVIWTLDNHFAKIRVKSINNERITFDWAYQTVKGEKQLKSINKVKSERSIEVLKKRGRI